MLCSCWYSWPEGYSAVVGMPINMSNREKTALRGVIRRLCRIVRECVFVRHTASNES